MLAGCSPATGSNATGKRIGCRYSVESDKGGKYVRLVIENLQDKPLVKARFLILFDAAIEKREYPPFLPVEHMKGCWEPQTDVRARKFDFCILNELPPRLLVEMRYYLKEYSESPVEYCRCYLHDGGL